MRKSRVAVSCDFCGGSFYVQPSRVGSRRYCSMPCGKAGGNARRSSWGSLNRASADYRRAQAERTRISWTAPTTRANHLAAMRSDPYRELRARNASRIVTSSKWLVAIAEYKDSGEAKRRCANRRLPQLPAWRRYVDVRDQEHYFRSGWEEALARHLDALGLTWQFEPRKFTFADNTTYTPDFRVESPFGSCYLESHRIEHIKPGDEEKVARIRRLAEDGGLDAPLILLGERDMVRIFRAVGMRYGRPTVSSGALSSAPSDTGE